MLHAVQFCVHSPIERVLPSGLEGVGCVQEGGARKRGAERAVEGCDNIGGESQFVEHICQLTMHMCVCIYPLPLSPSLNLPPSPPLCALN